MTFKGESTVKLHFRKVKDAGVGPVDWLLRQAPLPVTRSAFSAMGLGARLYYSLPGNHLRRTIRNFHAFCNNSNDSLFSDFQKNIDLAMSLAVKLVREGADSVAERVDFDGESLQRVRKVQEQYGCGIFVVPHCAGSVLSATRFGREFPSVVLVRESKSDRRAGILRPYFEKLGPELFYVRRSDPASVARGIIRVLHEKKFIIGTTDLARKTPDTVSAKVFGQEVNLPAWPARFSGRRNAPIIPGFIRMHEGRIVLMCGEPFIEKDLGAATQRWASYFEESIRKYPADWLFMFDKRWSRIIARAAGKA